MSATITFTCDGCGVQAVVPPSGPGVGAPQPGAVTTRWDLPLGWVMVGYGRAPWALHACKPTCKAVVELKYFTEDV